MINQLSTFFEAVIPVANEFSEHKIKEFLDAKYGGVEVREVAK